MYLCGFRIYLSLIFFFFFFISWRLITLQYCSGYKCSDRVHWEDPEGSGGEGGGKGDQDWEYM